MYDKKTEIAIVMSNGEGFKRQMNEFRKKLKNITIADKPNKITNKTTAILYITSMMDHDLYKIARIKAKALGIPERHTVKKNPKLLQEEINLLLAEK